MPETLLYKGQLHFCVEGSPTHIAPHRGATHLFKITVFPIFKKRTTCCMHVANLLKLISSHLNIEVTFPFVMLANGFSFHKFGDVCGVGIVNQMSLKYGGP